MIPEFQGDFRFLSNFWPCQIHFEGLHYSSVEAAYQAAKTDQRDKRTAFTHYLPGKAKREGRKLIIRKDWELVKIAVMRELLRLKFSDPSLQARLLATYPEELVEGNSWGDSFWGVDRKKGGQNQLGKLLMEIRADIFVDCP